MGNCFAAPPEPVPVTYQTKGWATCIGPFGDYGNTHAERIYIIQTATNVSATRYMYTQPLASVDHTFTSITVTDKDPRSKLCKTDRGDTFLLYAAKTTQGVSGSVGIHYYGKQSSPAPPQYGE
jgi:hypothetical protein